MNSQSNFREKDDANSNRAYLPIDAKFPKDVYEQLWCFFEAGDTALIESSGKQLENKTIKKMAKDIHDKYVDPFYHRLSPLCFCLFESIYAEVIRKNKSGRNSAKRLQNSCLGPTTQGAIPK